MTFFPVCPLSPQGRSSHSSPLANVTLGKRNAKPLPPMAVSLALSNSFGWKLSLHKSAQPMFQELPLIHHPYPKEKPPVRDHFKCFIYCPVLIYASVISPTAVCVFLFSNALVDGFAFVSSYLPAPDSVNLCLLNQMSKTGVHGGLPGNNLHLKFRVPPT